MLKNLIAAGAVAGALAFAIPSTPAQAIPGLKAVDTNPSAITDVRRRGRHFRGHRHARRHHWRGNRRWRGHRRWGSHRHWRHRHHRRWRGARYWGGYGYGWGRGCSWLHRRAIVTGSRYWWRRYYRCRGW